MNRAMLLAEITDIMGGAQASLKRSGVEMDQRTLRLFIDQFSARWKATPQRADHDLAKRLADAVHTDEVHHGGLLSRTTLHLANEVSLAVKAVPHDDGGDAAPAVEGQGTD